MTPFKEKINTDLARKISGVLGRTGCFDSRTFLKKALPKSLKSLELMQRVDLFADALKAGFRVPFSQSLPYILRLSKALPWGLGQWCLTRYVDKYGQAQFDLSMNALKELTSRCSSEFAVRSFIQAGPDRALRKLRGWLRDPDEHVRRWISEGTRPRLPWGRHLVAVRKNPRLTLPLLEALKNDPSPYVRKSVANHLNDIGKDHPALLLEIAGRWMKKGNPGTAWICRHACRNLIKQGNARALHLFGAGKATGIEAFRSGAGSQMPAPGPETELPIRPGVRGEKGTEGGRGLCPAFPPGFGPDGAQGVQAQDF